MKIIDRANAQYAVPRQPGTDAVHQRAAGGAEVRGHGVAGGGGARGGVGGEVGAAAEVGEVGVDDGEVGGEHRRVDFVAVGAVADEGVDEAGGGGGLFFFFPSVLCFFWGGGGLWEIGESGLQGRERKLLGRLA